MKESKARFDSAGVKLIAVGVGTPNKAQILAERVGNVFITQVLSLPLEVTPSLFKFHVTYVKYVNC